MTESTTPEGESTWAKLRRRKVVQWGIVYAAGAWGFLQGLEYASSTFDWPRQIQQLSTLALLTGLPVVLVLAWYHGDRGEQRVTRTELAILTLLFLLGGGLFWRYQAASEPSQSTTPTAAAPARAAAATDSGPSIAVLPFENRSKVEDEAFFVDGIHDDILTQLSKISALKVISRTSVEQFRDTRLPTKTIADQLGVKSILEGGVQRAGNRVRINVQLIDAATDAHLWAETYDRELTAENIFAIQTELSAAIAAALEAALTPAEKARAAVVPTRSLKAWEAYQLGRQRMAGRTIGGLAEAGRFFQQAIDLDPRFALAYAGLADSLAISTSQGAPLVATLQQAQAAAETALEIDAGLSEAWNSSGLIAEIREQYERAEPMYRRAIELDPNNAMAFKFYGGMLVSTLRIDEGVRSLQRAASLDPLSAIVQVNLADALQAQGSFAEAAAHYRRAIEIDPGMPAAYAMLGSCFADAFTRYADAVPLAQKAIDLDPDSPLWPGLLTWLYINLGDRRLALSTIEQAARRWPNDSGFQFWLAVRGLLQGDDAGAVRLAERLLALQPRSDGALFILRDADLRNGRPDEALARYRQAYPELFVAGAPHLDQSNYNAAIDVALVLQRRGDAAGAKVLLDAAMRVIEKLPRMGSEGSGISDVQILALRGEKAKALAALRKAEQTGWRSAWWYRGEFDPSLESIRNEPEFRAVFADIERDMARQRAELAARPKDAPLVLDPAH